MTQAVHHSADDLDPVLELTHISIPWLCWPRLPPVYIDFILTKLDIDKITKLIDERYVILFLKWLFQNNFWVIAITLLCEKWHITFRKLPESENKLSDRMISVTAKYSDFSVSRRSIICLSPWLYQLNYLLVTDKSHYLGQSHAINVNHIDRFINTGYAWCGWRSANKN